MGAFDCVTANRITPTESTEVFTIKTSSSYSLNMPSRDVEAQPRASWARRHHVGWMLSVDLPLLLIVLVIMGLFERGVIPGHKSGFYCNDPALSFPYTGDTVTAGMLMAGVFLGPVIIFIMTEFTMSEADETKSRLLQSLKTGLWLYRSYVYGLMMNLLIVEVMKGIVGGPRPTFFDLCAPDTAKTCKRTEFVSTFKCTSKYSWWIQMDSYRSFPSGHTSLSVYCALFVSWYLQSRAFNWRHRSILLVPVLQLTLLSFGAISSLTRITDRKHHWWDVLTGFFVGLLTLLYAVTFLCKNFAYARAKEEDKSEESRKTTRTLLYEEQTTLP